MRVLVLGDINSPHIIKWGKGLLDRGAEICLFSLSGPTSEWFKPYSNFSYEVADDKNAELHGKKSPFSKLNYLLSVSKIKRLIKQFKPDVLHAHYATSYGMLGAFTGFHPYIISVWGSDVYDFPQKGRIPRKVLSRNLNKSDLILSTGHMMAEETKKYTRNLMEVIPFGIDLERFSPRKVDSEKTEIVIGTVKTLEPHYGIVHLIQAFKYANDRLPDQQLKLLIVGKGSQEQELKHLVDGLGLNDHTEFAGFVPYEQVESAYHRLDIYVALSEAESFGVAILEASACELPVVVSDVGGLPEVVKEGQTGFIVENKDYEAAGEQLIRLVEDANLRNDMGKRGRQWVKDHYIWEDCLDQMMAVYERMKNAKH